MWPSKVSWNWNAMDVGPQRDLVGKTTPNYYYSSNTVNVSNMVAWASKLWLWYNTRVHQDKLVTVCTAEYRITRAFVGLPL